MPGADDEFDPTTLLEDQDHDEAETPEGEEEQNIGDGEEDSSSESGDTEEQDEAEDGEERADGLSSQDERPNSRERRSQNSWSRREEKHRAELEAERKRVADAEARLRLQDEERQREQATRQQQLNAQEAERLASMTPEERNAYEIDRLRGQVAYQNQMRELQTWDAQDKSKYEALANSDSPLGRIYKKNAAVIEKHLQDIRARNTNMPRDVLLRYELGDQVLKAMAANKPSKPQPTRKVQKPTNSRGDAGRTPARSNPSSDHEKRKERLKDVRL